MGLKQELIVGLLVSSTLLVSTVFSQECATFLCYADSKSIVNIYGMNLTCPDGQVCNAKDTSSCVPCITPSTTCDDKFTCDGAENEVTIGDTKLNCPTNYICNAKFEDPCDLCVQKKCEDSTTTNWSCKSDDPTVVIISNAVMKCADGYVCNANKVAPCQPCISNPTAQVAYMNTLLRIYGN